MTEIALDPPSLADYQPPLVALLSIGEPDAIEPKDWADYAEDHGLHPGHAAELIRMACDMALHERQADDPAVWAPVHAWRALAQMRRVEALPHLTRLLRDHSDLVATDDLMWVFAAFGPPAIPILSQVATDRWAADTVTGIATNALEQIARSDPDSREACVTAIAAVLRPEAAMDPTAVGLAIGSLIEMRAAEVITAIRDAFARDAVDLSITGDLEDVEIDLGLRLQRSTPRPRYQPFGHDWRFREEPANTPAVSHKIGRNAPCPCGSGKKYKKCCIAA
jgi:hypothetical protein